MKILHLMAGLGETSGVANIARRFARMQTERGDTAVLLAPAFKWNPIYFGPLFATRATWHARTADEIWVHCSWTFPVWYGAALARLFGKKLIVVPEGSFDPKRIGNHAGWKKRLVRPLDRWVIRQASDVLALCADEVDWVRTFESTAKVRLAQVPTFYAHVKIKSPPAHTHPHRPLHVLFLGRVNDPLKGVRHLEQAVHEINRHNPDSPSIDLRLGSTLCGAAKEAAWGWADVLCLPTLSDNFGLVVAEALEHGCPVITTDGASAWAHLKSHEGIYLTGYRKGDDTTRVRLLTKALLEFTGNNS